MHRKVVHAEGYRLRGDSGLPWEFLFRARKLREPCHPQQAVAEFRLECFRSPRLQALRGSVQARSQSDHRRSRSPKRNTGKTARTDPKIAKRSRGKPWPGLIPSILRNASARIATSASVSVR